jgi:short-subunit dehydrogenase
LAESDLAAQLNLIQVNLTALTALTQLFLQGMVRRGHGKILNVASTAAFQPGPLMSVYYAGKAYVLSFSEAIANELEGTGVTVTTLCPGPTRTEFHEAAGMGGMYLLRKGVLDASTVAWVGYRGMVQGRRVVIPGLLNKALALLARWAPRDWVIRAVRRLQERRKDAHI